MRLVLIYISIVCAALIPAAIIFIAVKAVCLKRDADGNFANHKHELRSFAIPAYVALGGAVFSVVFAILSFVFR